MTDRQLKEYYKASIKRVDDFLEDEDICRDLILGRAPRKPHRKSYRIGLNMRYSPEKN